MSGGIIDESGGFGQGNSLLEAGGGDSAANYKPWYLRDALIRLLRGKNDCSDWFNHGTGSAADLISHVPIVLGNPNPGPLPGADADTEPNPNAPITVYPDGRFYPNSDNQLPIGDFKPGSHAARMIIMLHELAHKVSPPGFTDDAFSTSDSEKNTKKVMEHCAAAVGR